MQSQVRLGGSWLNNTTILYIPQALQTELAQEAERRNDIVFQEPGLTVFAAPWQYAFCAKLDRMSKSSRREYDILDATIYLRRYVEKSGNQEVSIKQVRQWASRYGTQATDQVVREVDVEYARQYHHNAIRW